MAGKASARPSIEGRRIVVTGGAGFIGSHIAQALQDSNEVVVIDDLSTGRRVNLEVLPKCRFVEASVCSTDVLMREFKDVDFVFHQAAIPSVPRSIEDPAKSNLANVTGTLSVLDAARRCDVSKVMFASSSSVYGDTPVLPKKEDMAPNPLSPYAVTKLAGEQYCRVFFEIYGMPTTALRYFNVYGPRQDPQSQYAAVIPRFVSAVMAGRPPNIYGDGEQTRDFTFVLDTVKGNLLAAQSPKTDGLVVNCATGARITVNQLFEKISALLGSDMKANHIAPQPGDVRHSLSDISRAKELMGYQPDYNIDTGLAKTVDFFRGQKNR